MNKLDSSVILKLLREERAKQLNLLRREIPTLNENIDVVMNVEGTPKKVVTPGLKLRDKQGGKLYTVQADGVNSVRLTDPNGQTVDVSDSQLETGFDLD